MSDPRTDQTPSDPASEWFPLDHAEHWGQVLWLEQTANAVRGRGGAAPRVLDLGAGDGRLALEALSDECDVTAVDHDVDACARLREAAAAAIEQTAAGSLRVIQGDMLDQAAALAASGERFDVVLCLGNTLLTLHDPRRARRLFAEVRTLLADSGVFAIDNFPADLWADVAEGNWQLGLSSDDPKDPDRLQLAWAPGDCVVAFRAGRAIDLDADHVKPSDRPLRLYSLGELRLLAEVAGFGEPVADARHHVLVFRSGADQ